MGAALQDLANRVPLSLLRRDLPRVDRVLEAWNRHAAVRTQLQRVEDLARFGVFAFGENDARVAGAHLLVLGEATATDLVRTWERNMIRLGHSDRTRERRIYAVRQFTRAANEIGASSWRLSIGPTNDAAEVPSAGEVESAIDRLQTERRRRDLALVLLAYDCGLALGEMLAITVGDVDFGTGAITTPRRRADLTARTIAALREAIDGDGHDPLFLGTRGGELAPISARRVFRALGLGSPDCVRRAGLERSAA